MSRPSEYQMERLDRARALTVDAMNELRAASENTNDGMTLDLEQTQMTLASVEDALQDILATGHKLRAENPND